MTEEEIREKNPYGFCCICGNINTEPKKWGPIWPCKECFLMRTPDIMDMIKAYNLLLSENE